MRAVELFTKDSKLPPELRPLRYDVNSVTHFGDREFSKNGHRTIIFKDHNVQQNRNGLSELDLRKIEIVYGPECLKRERQEKIELCQNYPGVARRKREIDISVGGASLRVNRDITAPPAINTTEALSALAQLGVENEAHDIKERVHQLSSRALTNAQVKYCNGTAPHLRSDGDTGSDGADPLGTVELLADYAKSIVDHAGENTKSFCEAADSLYVYQRTRCIYEGYGGCRGYRSTKSGDVKHSTQHRPTYQYPTKHPNRESKYEPMSYRTGNNSDADKVRRKREAATVGDAIWSKEKEKTNGIDVKSKPTASPTDKTVSDARRRFKEIPFSVHKHKKSAKEKVYASDLSLEGEQGKLFKNNRPAANIRLAQRKKKMNGERRKREASAVTTSQPDEVGQAEDVNRKETSTDNLPTTDKGPASDQITVSNRSETGGRRKFKDTQYRVYKGKNNEKKRTYASELSLESKQVKRFKKINRGTRTAKQRSGRRGMIRDPADRVRRKRETAPDESPVQANGDADEDVAKEKTDNDSPSADAAAGVDQTVEGRRRFGDIPFNVYNKKKNGKEEGYASDLSLEDKQDKASKKNRQMKSHLTQRKKKRGEDRSEETRPVSERDRTPRKAAPRTVELSKDNEEFYAERRWPDGIVRYMIKDIPKYDLDDVRYRLEEVNKILKEKTCTRLMEITDDERSLFEDYLVLDNSPDYVTGRVGGKQCVAVWRKGDVEVIPNEQGNRTTPSYVAFTNRERLIGEAAKNQATANAANTIFGAKRLIGRRYDDVAVQMDMRHWPFKVASDGGKPRFVVCHKTQRRTFAPEEISGMILSRMREAAEVYLGRAVGDAVVTVPAYFNDAQRQATRAAGAIAGLNVLRIVNEPTAAALAYGLGRHAKGERRVLVYDLGGGTLDVSMLTISEGVYEVKATAGNTRLGGEDFDNRLAAYFAEDFRKRYGREVLGNAKAFRKLKSAAERAKRFLTSAAHATVQVESLWNEIDYCGKVTRDAFEELCSDLFEDALQPLERVLSDARLRKEDVHDVVLVGGGTRMPKIRGLVRDFFEGRPVSYSVNPEEAVACGAAIQAAILSGERHERIQDLLLVDVVPLSLGVETARGVMYKVIERNTPIPCRHTRDLTTLEDYQRSMTIEIFEGERTLTKDNNLLGVFELDKIPPAPRGVATVDVTFDVDANGILSVVAQDRSTGNTNSMVITNEHRLKQHEIGKMIADAEAFREEDSENKRRLEVRNQLESYVYSVKQTVTENIDKLTANEISTLTRECKDAIEWLELNPDCLREEYERKMSELLTHWSCVMRKFCTSLRHRAKRQRSELQCELEGITPTMLENVDSGD
ncbi:unnamed protein product, partial [Iphiclides podalirius]